MNMDTEKYIFTKRKAMMQEWCKMIVGIIVRVNENVDSNRRGRKENSMHFQVSLIYIVLSYFQYSGMWFQCYKNFLIESLDWNPVL